MNTRAEYQSEWSRNDPGYRHETSTQYDTGTSSTTGRGLGSAMNSMMTAPFWMTAAGINWMTSGMQRLGQSMGGSSPSQTTTTGSSGKHEHAQSAQASGSSDRSSWSDWANPANWGTGSSSRPMNDQDLSGEDLKYVSWTLVFTKPGYEAVLEPMQCDLVNYSTDNSSYAAMKIAKFLERARYGTAEKPHGWVEHDYPSEPAAAARRAEASAKAEGSKHDGSKQEASKGEKESNGWRLPSDDQKYVQFLYRVDWRLPKQQAESTRVDRVTVERTSNAHAKIIV